MFFLKQQNFTFLLTNSSSQSVEQILRNYVKVPCFMGAQIGHDGQQWTMPIGIEVEIDAAAGTITMLEKAMQD